MHFGTQRYSAVGSYALPRDWRGYHELVFLLHNLYGEALPIVLRINDRQHEQAGPRYADRFNRGWIVQPGWNEYRIALDEVLQTPERMTMNMAESQQTQLLVHALEQPRTLYIACKRLEIFTHTDS